jgi:hypothetical protein
MEQVEKFLQAFIPAFLGTGVLLGVGYILVARALKIDRDKIEEWCESLRKRLQAGPVPIIEWAHPVMIGVLSAVYGRTLLRRFAASLAMASVFTFVMFSIFYLTYSKASSDLRLEKSQMERDVDPTLYRYYTDRQLRVEYDKAWEHTFQRYGKDDFDVIFIHNDGIYKQLRTSYSDYEDRLARRLIASPDSAALTPLFLLEGNYINSGFQWTQAIPIFIFNVFLDFVSVTIVFAALRRMKPQMSLSNAIASFVQILGGTVMCAAIAFLSYRLFFRGDISFFLQLVVLFPTLFVAAMVGVTGVAAFIASLFKREPISDSLGPTFMSVIFGCAGVGGLNFLWGAWRPLSLGVWRWQEVFSFPYVLATTTVVPATLTLTALGLMLVAKFTVEPARVLPEAYMTYIHDEVRGTQAAGAIALLGVLAGVVAGLVWGT